MLSAPPAVLPAACNALASTPQREAARREAAEENVNPCPVRCLLHRPVRLGRALFAVPGFLLHAVALHAGLMAAGMAGLITAPGPGGQVSAIPWTGGPTGCGADVPVTAAGAPPSRATPGPRRAAVLATATGRLAISRPGLPGNGAGGRGRRAEAVRTVEDEAARGG
ncbi:hypothetical protein [Streptomyces anandii]|uniref:Uncharacterized protein n=1 Tax=Streptomyces anandii TaxID=285454 RepID=A0ABW6H5G3_9ACTN